MTVEATIEISDIGGDPQIGNKVGKCDGEIRELKTSEGKVRVDVLPSGGKCSYCLLKKSCTASMDGYL